MPPNPRLFEDSLSIRNNTANPLRVWLEPWCEEVLVPVGSSIELRAEGIDVGKLEIEENKDATVVFGWPTSRLKIFLEGQQIWESYADVPPVPKGSIKTFVKDLFWKHTGPPTQQ
jgi:hypothetical protein